MRYIAEIRNNGDILVADSSTSLCKLYKGGIPSNYKAVIKGHSLDEDKVIDPVRLASKETLRTGYANFPFYLKPDALYEVKSDYWLYEIGRFTRTGYAGCNYKDYIYDKPIRVIDLKVQSKALFQHLNSGRVSIINLAPSKNVKFGQMQYYVGSSSLGVVTLEEFFSDLGLDYDKIYGAWSYAKYESQIIVKLRSRKGRYYPNIISISEHKCKPFSYGYLGTKLFEKSIDNR